MNLLELLASDLIAYMDAAPDDVPRRVLLWLDPESQFSRLVPYLEPTLGERSVRLLRYDHDKSGQFAIKQALLRLEAEGDGRAVVYLPGFAKSALMPKPDGSAPDLWGVYEYRYKGCVWGRGESWQAGAVPDPPTLLSWLRRHGMSLSDDKATKELTVDGADSLLARYCELKRTTSPAEWPCPLRSTDVRNALAGDPRDALRRLLAAPNNEVKQWGSERPLVLERIADEYGLTAPDGEATPDDLLDAFVVQLALAEAWDAFGRPDDFPFLARLPQKTEHRQRQAQILREDILKHTELAPRFKERMQRLEPSYNLATWAATRKGEPAGLPLLAGTRWREFLSRFDEAAAKSWKDAHNLLITERETLVNSVHSPWDGEQADTQWFVLKDLASLAVMAAAAVDESTGLKRAADLVMKYAGGWWEVDRLHLRVRAVCSRLPGLEKVRWVADCAYFEYVSRTNQVFTDLVEGEGTWPPQGTTGVETLRPALWKAEGKRQAVILSDACRWDILASLKEGIARECAISPVVASLPTDTPFGMTALLPLEEGPVTVAFDEGKLSIKQGESDNLATREGRKAFLRASLLDANGKPAVDFVDMNALLQGADIPGTSLVVVLDNTIDEQGHKGTEALPALVEQLIGNLGRTVDRLHAGGIGVVHLVSDHGFLLLPGDAVDALGTPQVLPIQAQHKDVRWAVLKPDAPAGEVIRLPLPLAAEVLLGLPRGVRTLMKAPAFMHGGISLQECVVGHFVSRAAVRQAQIDLDLRVTTAELSGGTVPVILRPVVAELQQPLGGLLPLVIKLWVETEAASDATARRVTEDIEVELRADVEEIRPPVYLKEGLALKAGQQLLLKAVEKLTGRDLGVVALKLLVDWD